MSANSSPEGTHQGPQLIPTIRLLNSILDRLQKKDKFGVFAEPVDGKEVPNYYDIIKNPMDFGTVRSRISSSHYTSLDLFQRDIFLICDNAMQYNGKGTVYFRHARAIRDALERTLEDLKLSGLSAEIDEHTGKSKNGGACKITDKHDSSMNAGSPSETRTDNLDEVSGYMFKASGFTDGRTSQPLYENCRSTYAPLTTLYQGSDSLSTTISGDSLHLVPTGYQIDFPYSKSLARFAADLGPLVWNIAAEKIKKSLPPGCSFGPGWVGECETSGVLLNPSSKQGILSKATIEQKAKVPRANAVIATSDMSALLAVESKSDSQMKSPPNHGSTSNVMCQPSLQNPTKLPVEVRSPTVFVDSLPQIEKSEGAERQVFGQTFNQPMVANLRSPENCRSLGQGQLQSNRETSGNAGQVRLPVSTQSTLAGMVNLNHPLSFPSDKRGSDDDCALVRDPALNGRHELDCKTARPGSAIPHVNNAAGLPFVGRFDVGSSFNARVPQIDNHNLLKATMAETSMNASVSNQYDGKHAAQPNRFNLLNDGSCLKAGLSAPGAIVNDANLQANNSLVTCVPIMAHNLNTPLQKPSSIRRDTHSFEPSFSTLSQPQSTHVFSLQNRLNATVKNTQESRQHSYSSNHQISQNVSLPEHALSTLSVPPCSEQVIINRSSKLGDLREQEMLSIPDKMNSGSLAAVPRKGYHPRKGFEIHHPEERNGLISRIDVASGTITNFEELNRNQNASLGLSIASFATVLPSSNGVTMACEVPSWVPAQQTDFARVNGSATFQSHALTNPQEFSEKPSGVVPPTRLQTLGSQIPQSYTFATKKHKPSVPHFLQHQLAGNNSPSIASQNQQVQLHMQSNSLLSGVRNPSPPDSVESNFVRQFQPPSHPNFLQASNLPWQYMSPQITHGNHRPPLAMAPDLNMSLPLTKSSFDQSNGNEVQHPDLALQL